MQCESATKLKLPDSAAMTKEIHTGDAANNCDYLQCVDFAKFIFMENLELRLNRSRH